MIAGELLTAQCQACEAEFAITLEPLANQARSRELRFCPFCAAPDDYEYLALYGQLSETAAAPPIVAVPTPPPGSATVAEGDDWNWYAVEHGGSD